jgi:hypothetical protein
MAQDKNVSPVKSHEDRKATRRVMRLSPTTVERSRTDANPLLKRFTNFRFNFRNPIQIPKNLIHPGRKRQDNRFHLDVGQIPEE